MKTKIVSYLAICILVISAGVAVAQQQGSSSGITEEETAEMMGKIVEEESPADGDALSEMKDASTWNTEMRSFGLPPLNEIQAEVERKTYYMDPFLSELKENSGHAWSARNCKEGDMIWWAYHYNDSVGAGIGAPHTFSGKITDYGNHDDTYLVIWFEYPSWNYEYAVLMPGQSSATTSKCTLNSDYQLVLMYQYKHTPEAAAWDWKVTTTHHKPRYYAVIAGNGWNCAYADNDAYDMYGLLTSEFNSNWDKSNIRLLVSREDGTKHDCTRTKIRDGIAWMASQANADDVCVFFYAGHGGWQADVAPLDESDGVDEYICPEGGNILDDELNTWLSAIPGYKLVAIDSCFSGGFIKADGMVSRSVPDLPRAEITDGFAQDFCRAGEDLCKAGFNVHTACDEDESAWGTAELNNGVFTYYLVQGLYGPADSDADNDVDSLEAHYYTRPKVISYTGGKQNPWICPATTDPLIWVLG